MKELDYDQTEFRQEQPTVIALGNFDGVHRGHQKLLVTAKEIAKKRGLCPSVLLFKNHTSSLLEAKTKRYLMQVEDKTRRLHAFGIENIFLCTFNAAFAAQEKEVFIRDILYRDFQVRHVVVGKDYRFGAHAAGSVADLLAAEKEGLFRVRVVDDVCYEGARISSTRIREAIQQGEVDRANAMLGFPYTISGKVVHGKRRGHGLGFATANLGISFPYLIPHEGVYLTEGILHGESHFGMTSVGTNPTFQDGTEIRIETHFFDFTENIYDVPMALSFLRFARKNIRFSDPLQLTKQMQKDEALLRSWAKEWQDALPALQ